MRWRMAPIGIAAMVLSAAPAAACSVGNPPAATAAERVAGKTGLLRVEGELRLRGVEPAAAPERAQTVHGEIVTANGKTLAVDYLYSEVWVACVIYYLPQADARGRFYLSRHRRGGGYELVDWTGTYIEGGAGIVSPQDESQD